MNLSAKNPLLWILLIFFNSLLNAQNAKNNEDEFERIAGRSEYVRSGWKFNLPPELPQKFMDSQTNNPAIVIPEYNPMDSLHEYKRELEALTGKFAHFLKDYSPSLPETRQILELKTFQFRKETKKDANHFQNISRGEGKWEEVTLPHYIGPIGEWTGYYRKEVDVPTAFSAEKNRLILSFGAVDYIAEVFMNGNYVGSHEGFFAPFDIDISRQVIPNKKNVLLIRVINKYKGHQKINGRQYGGDKIYAGTGLGWDEPGKGWVHCPPGAGIYQDVTLEVRPKTYISDLAVLPDIDHKEFELRVGVNHEDTTINDVRFSVSVFAKNFKNYKTKHLTLEAAPPGIGDNEYHYQVHFSDFRTWSPDSPWLYEMHVTIENVNTGEKDTRRTHFGMRKFYMDDTSAYKGSLYLNNHPVILRGANTMGHMQQAVLKNDTAQIIEDIMIAKMANINYYRLTQRPVQPLIYELCDRLGMMLQTDLPLFGHLRFNKMEEALRQTGEMEKFVRGYPSNIMVSLINEPFPDEWGNNDHRFLSRKELENFMFAAREVIHVYNPSRVVKAADGDYYPPVPYGLPDMHCYAGWYSSNLWHLGQLMHDYFLPSKNGWKVACGEYGAEGLVDENIMFNLLPNEWIPNEKSLNAKWHPIHLSNNGGKSSFAQTARKHHYWFEEQETLGEWIKESQKHQAFATRELTRSFRRQTYRMPSTALHILIDAWPVGWMKAVVDVDRNPKQAYYEYRDALTPLMVDIRNDRRQMYGGTNLNLEFWICNDKQNPENLEDAQLYYEVLLDNDVIFSNSAPAKIPSYNSKFQGFFGYETPTVNKKSNLKIRLAIVHNKKTIHLAEKNITLYPLVDKSAHKNVKVLIVGDKNGRAWNILNKYGYSAKLFNEKSKNAKVIIVDDISLFNASNNDIIKQVEAGSKLIFLNQDPSVEIHIPGDTIRFFNVDRPNHGLYMVSRNRNHPIIKGYTQEDFKYWYSPRTGYMDYMSKYYSECSNNKNILFFTDDKPIVTEKSIGKGNMILMQLISEDFAGIIPTFDSFLNTLINYEK